MSHEIFMQANGSASMAYVGNRPWHGLGEQLPEGADITEWVRAAGFDFRIEGSSVRFFDQQGVCRIIPNRRALHRSDTGGYISTVSDVYKVVQPSEVMDFFSRLSDAGGWKMETAGVLGTGAKYWALARISEDVSIAGDRHSPYMLLATSADKTLATIAKPTMTRVVCSNTLGMALHKGDGEEIKVKHSSTFDPDSVIASLGLFDAERTISDFSEQMNRLVDVEISPTEATDLFADLLRPAGQRKPARPVQDLAAQSFADLLQSPVTSAPSAPATYAKDSVPVSDESTRAIRGLADLERSYYQAPGAKPGTGYGVIQGVTHWLDHVRGKDSDARMSSSFFGQGAALKEKAVSAVERFAAENA